MSVVITLDDEKGVGGTALGVISVTLSAFTRYTVTLYNIKII